MTVNSGKVRLTLKRQGKNWRLRESDDYMVDPQVIRRAILRAGELTYFEMKTRKPVLYGRLELGDPSAERAESKRVVLKDGSGTVMADFVSGRETIYLPGMSVGGVYFRLPESPQAWLGRGNPEIGPATKDWLQREFVDIDHSRVRRIVTRHPGGETVVVSKSNIVTKKFKLHDIPDQMRLKYDSDADLIGAILDGMELEDARRAGAVRFPPDKTVTVLVETFDGLRAKMETTEHRGQHWVRLFFAADPGKKKARAEAEGLAVLTRPWVYRVGKHEVVPILRRMEDLLIPNSGG